MEMQKNNFKGLNYYVYDFIITDNTKNSESMDSNFQNFLQIQFESKNFKIPALNIVGI